MFKQVQDVWKKKKVKLDYLPCKVIMLRHLPGKPRQLKDTAGRSLIAEKHKFRRMARYCARIIKNCSSLNASWVKLTKQDTALWLTE